MLGIEHKVSHLESLCSSAESVYMFKNRLFVNFLGKAAKKSSEYGDPPSDTQPTR